MSERKLPDNSNSILQFTNSVISTVVPAASITDVYTA